MKTKQAAPKYLLIEGRCEDELTKLDRPVDLLIADSPYNIQVQYDIHDDNLPFEQYMAWTEKWLESAYAALAKHGSMWLLYPDELDSFVDVFCQRQLGLHKRAKIVWHYSFGVCNSAKKNFSRSHANWLYYTKTKTKFTFNGDAVSVPSARAMIYGDKRAHAKGKAADDVWLLHRSQFEGCFRPDQDTWLESRVCGTFKERQKDSPNQLPVAMLERIVLSTSNPGDFIVDPFNGSGSSAIAALKHGRHYAGIDISPTYLKNTDRRIAAEVPGVKGEVVLGEKAKTRKKPRRDA